MRILIYGMQSSGASLFTFFVAQNPWYLGIIDLYSSQLAPPLIGEKNVVLKCTITTKYRFEQHRDSFQPDQTVLVLRNPMQNFSSLAEKKYATHDGSVDDKFSLLEQYAQATHLFDHVVRFEDFLLGEVSLPFVKPVFYSFSRSLTEVVDYTCMSNEWCRKNYLRSWGVGNIHEQNLQFLKLRELCPSAVKFYLEPSPAQ